MSNENMSLLFPLLIEEQNLSIAWGKAVLHVMKHVGVEISPLIICVTGFDDNGTPVEDNAIRQGLDSLLKEKNFRSTEDVAFTIFPQRIWEMSNGNRERLWQLYLYSYCSYKAMNSRDNKRGLYFQRLINYEDSPCGKNQLEWILSQYEKRNAVRRSMLQAGIFDPKRDHVANAQLQFPCMQQVSFVPTEQGLVINAFYATQQLFVKAYGNYLGIAQLGAFMAHEMKMKLFQINVMIGVAKFERMNKTDFKAHPLFSTIKASVATSDLNKNVAGAAA